MKNARERRPIRLSIKIALIAIALLAVAALVLIGVDRYKRGAEAARPKSLVLVHDLADRDLVRALDAVLAAFTSLYPNISVRARYAEDSGLSGASGDVLVSRAAASLRNGAFAAAPTPWTGQLWVLAARTDYLDAAAARQTEAVAAMRAGTANPAQFEILLADASAAGFTPIAIGNSHRWPFLLWLQHWTAAKVGPAAAAAFPAAAGGAPSAAAATESAAAPAVDAYAGFRQPFADLMRWKAQSWFYPAGWPLGWAKGLAAIDNGPAVFALVSARQLAAISSRGRARLEYLPFPRRTADEAWSIGDATFLGLSSGAAEPEAAALLVKYLSSPGVTVRLSEAVAQPFFSWDPETGAGATILKDWTGGSMGPDYEAFATEFDPGR